MWKRTLRIAFAALVAPLATLGVVGVWVIVMGLVQGHEAWEMRLNYTPFALYGIFIAYPATLFLGVPVHLALSHFRVGHVWAHALAGGFLALLITVVEFDLLETVREDWRVLVTYVPLFVFTGAAVAAVFGAMAGEARERA